MTKDYPNQFISSANNRTCRAYPTVFINWPDDYTYSRVIHDPESQVDCDIVATPVVVPITTPGPQFTTGDRFDYNKAQYGDTKTLADPRGLFVDPVGMGGSGYPFLRFNFLLPSWPCVNYDLPDGSPAWGGFVNSWAFATSTRYR